MPCLAVIGSSPRVRGKPLRPLTHSYTVRIIPARAGQTVSTCIFAITDSDHPRACGANTQTLIGLTGESGSSPRVRGKLALLRVHAAGGRIIPARAGQTIGRLKAPSWTTDHPRACGANWTPGAARRNDHGSSPRVRGKPVDFRRRRLPRRIIPARAGQTTVLFSRSQVGTDHPRACGANQVEVAPFEPVSGSSPRVRGKRCW